MADAQQSAGTDLPELHQPSLAQRVTIACFLAIFLAACASLPVIIWEMWVNGFQLHAIAWAISGAFCSLTVPITLYEVANHLKNFRSPKLQRYVIRILWMPAVYSIDSWLSLRWKGEALYWEAVRDIYEAWVIYAFYSYLCAYLEGEKGAPGSLCVNPIIIHSPDHKHMFPFGWLKTWTLHDGQFVRLTHLGVAQYCFINIACAVVTFATEHTKTFHDGTTKPTAWPYVAFTINVSQVWALYCLVLMYHSFAEPLKPINPFMKFVVIKGVVFLTFWQDMVLTGLVHQGIIKQEESWSSYNPETSYTLEEVKDGLQNFIVVIEMFVAALAYAYAFPFYDYKDRPGRVPLTFGQALRAVFGVGDVLRDVVFNFGCVKREFAESEIDASVYNRAEAAGLEVDENGNPVPEQIQPQVARSMGPPSVAPQPSDADMSGYDQRAPSATPPPTIAAPAPAAAGKKDGQQDFVSEVSDVFSTFLAAIFGGGAAKKEQGAAPSQQL